MGVTVIVLGLPTCLLPSIHGAKQYLTALLDTSGMCNILEQRKQSTEHR